MFGLFLSSGGGIQKKTDMIKFGSEFPTFCPTTRAWLSLVKFGTNSQFPTFSQNGVVLLVLVVWWNRKSDSGDCSDTTNKPKNKNTSSRKVCEGEVETECHI